MKLKRIEEFVPEATKLTEFCRSTPPNKVSVMECESLREFRSATTTAYNVRSEKRTDDYKVKISLDSIAQTVTVGLTK